MITTPEYVTGRRLWLLALPRTVTPADPGFEPGQVSTIVQTIGLPTGTVAVHTGGPRDTFAVQLEVMTAGAPGVLAVRYRLQTTDAWSLTQTVPADGVLELLESGLVLLFAGTFGLGATFTFTTIESAQQAALRKGLSGEVARVLRTRGDLPLAEWGVDLELLTARVCAWELLGLRGYDPKSAHDQLIMERARRAWENLRAIREELEQGDWPGQDATAGVAASSEEAQAVGLW